jgi:hypothetical protein
MSRKAVFVVLALLVAAGCTVAPKGERPDGPFDVVLFATADTRGELEPCG